VATKTSPKRRDEIRASGQSGNKDRDRDRERERESETLMLAYLWCGEYG